MSKLPGRVKVVEVGARDGLQNEPQMLPTSTKIDFINRLSTTRLETIEVTSFVSPRWIPQLQDAKKVCRGIDKIDGVSYSVLVPNKRGIQRAVACGIEEVAVFTAASETFNKKNINASIRESIERFVPVMDIASKHAVRVRGYISCVLGCPYEGQVDIGLVASLAEELLGMGCYEVSLGDTIGMGTPLQAQRMLETVAQRTSMDKLAIHFHDTRGQAMANILACLQLGVGVVDGSVAGLGGCPFAAGAAGNVATEDLVYMLHGMGVETGIDLEALVEVSRFISTAIGKPPASKLARLPKHKIDPFFMRPGT